MPHPFLIFSQSNCLIQIVDINSHTEWQTVQIQISWLLICFRSQLIWIYTVCKCMIYPGSAGLGLRVNSQFLFTDALCPSEFETVNFGCYLFGQTAVGSYNDAFLRCFNRGGYLLNIDTESENNITTDTLKEQTNGIFLLPFFNNSPITHIGYII